MKPLFILLAIALSSSLAYAQKIGPTTTVIQQPTTVDGLGLISPEIDGKGRLASMIINGRKLTLIYTDDFSKKPFAFKIDGITRTMRRTGKVYSREEIDTILSKHGTSAAALADPENLAKVTAAVQARRSAGCDYVPEQIAPNSSIKSAEEGKANVAIERPSNCDDYDVPGLGEGGGYSGGGNSGGGGYSGDVPGFGDAGEMEDGDFWDSYFGNIYGMGSQTWGNYALPVCRIETSYCMQSCSNWATAAYGICAVGAAGLGVLNPLAGATAGAVCFAIAYQKAQACYLDCQVNVVCH